jgi:predicted metalloendopeptidase
MSWYLTFRLLSAHGSYLTTAVRDEKFTMSQALTGVTTQQPRWKFCSASTENYLGELVGRYFVLQYFSVSQIFNEFLLPRTHVLTSPTR